MYKNSLHHLFLCLCGSLFFFVSACNQSKLENDDAAAAAPAAAAAAADETVAPPVVSPPRDIASDNHSVLPTASGESLISGIVTAPVALESNSTVAEESAEDVSGDQSEPATANDTNSTTGTPPAKSQQEGYVSSNPVINTIRSSDDETPQAGSDSNLPHSSAALQAEGKSSDDESGVPEGMIAASDTHNPDQSENGGDAQVESTNPTPSVANRVDATVAPPVVSPPRDIASDDHSVPTTASMQTETIAE
jgi:hypothetical protein